MDKDLKDTIKKLEEAKKRQEKLEKTIIILAGILIVIVFTVIGINIYSGKEEKVSQPEINIVGNKTAEVAKVVQNEEKKVVKQEQLKKDEIKKTVEGADKAKEVKSAVKQNKEKVKQKIEKPKKETKTVKKQKEKEKHKVVKKQNKSITTAQKDFYYIQVGAFSSKENAEKAKKQYKIPLSRFYIVKTGKLYKLLIGKFKTRKEAQSFMRKYGLKGLIKKI